MKKFLILGASAAALSFGMVGSAAAQFPAFGFDTQPAVIITLNGDGSTTVTDTGQGPFDGIEDTYVGVVNNSGHAVGSIHLTSSADIFGFDGDGIDAYGSAGNAIDTTGYGGPQGFFTNIAVNYNPSFTESGDVNFIGGIGNGKSSYFSLEENIDSASFTQPITSTGTPEPAAWAMMLMGFFGLGAAVRSRKQVLA